MIVIKHTIDTSRMIDPEKIREGIELGLSRIAEFIKNDIQENAVYTTKDDVKYNDGRMPVFSGNLWANMFTAKVGPMEYIVSNSAEYARDIEFGDVQHTEVKAGKFEEWIEAEDKWGRYVKQWVQTGGMVRGEPAPPYRLIRWIRQQTGTELTFNLHAHPFMKPALERFIEQRGNEVVNDFILGGIKDVIG
jgi:hypothetical protein